MTELPSQGFVFWPVGTGDSTTIPVISDLVMQVDLHDLVCADEDDDPHTPIVERLIELLPRRNGTPYLSVFVLTHPDEDHCCGFAKLLSKVSIGELWHTPRVFREFTKDYCEDAKAFRREAKRRVRTTIDNNGNVGSGDRVRIIGYDELLNEDDYRGFPKDRLTVPGNAIYELDGTPCGPSFHAFIHAPFKEDCDGPRNETSLAMQVTIANGDAFGYALLCGDLSYPTLKRIFKRSKDCDLFWNALLAPHHCSKSVMYFQGPEDRQPKLKQDILDDFERVGQVPGYIIASSEPIPATDTEGANPPHRIAADHYMEIVPNEFLCTQEHPNTADPQPLVFTLTERGLQYVAPATPRAAPRTSGTLAAAVAAARGSNEPPRDRVGFGIQPGL